MTNAGKLPGTITSTPKVKSLFSMRPLLRFTQARDDPAKSAAWIASPLLPGGTLRHRLGWRIISSVETNFFIFRERLAIACRLRGITYEQLCSGIGLGGGRRAVDLEHAGLRALDIYRLAQIADRLDVSIDWLLGRSKAMELREKQCQGEIG